MSTEITRTNDAALAALLDDPEFVDGYDGYSDGLGVKIRITRMMWNAKGLDANGRSIPKDMWFNSNTEELQPVLECVLAHIHSRKAFSEYDEAANKYTTYCSSADGVVGLEVVDQEGTTRQRPCKGCPDAEWHTTAKGKRTVNCSDYHDVTAVNLESMEPFMMTFKRSSERALLDHIKKHHHKKLKLPDKRVVNLPMYTYRVSLRLRMHESGNYALPVFERRDAITPDEARMYRETTQALREALKEGRAEVAGDTSFNPEEMG